MHGPGLDRDAMAPLDARLQAMVDQDEQTGLAWLVASGADVHVGAAGAVDPTATSSEAVDRSTIFRISSMTKPITALATLMLVDDGVLRLDDPVDDLLPELADRRVLADPEGAIDDTVAAVRPITVDDLLTFRLGHGYDFSATGPQPVMDEMARIGMAVGPPRPQEQPAPDEWMRLLGSLPLARQPGERWMYHTGSDVLGVLVARAAGRPLDAVLADRIFEPLGMADTGFSVAPEQRHRFGPCLTSSGADGREVFDAADGQWARPPAFPSGGAGLVSTVDDYFAFARLLLDGGTAPDGTRLVSAEGVAQMTADHLTAAQVAEAGPDPDGRAGWGYGVSVRLASTPGGPAEGTYGWDGGLGSSWANDPRQGLVGVLMTNQMWTSPEPPAVCAAFWTGAFAGLAGAGPGPA